MGSRLNSESLDSSRSRSFETRSLPSFDSCAPAQFELSVLPIYVARAPAAPFSPLPSRLCLDHSHCPVLVPATLAALPSTRAIETRLLPSFDSCAPAQFELSVLPIYVARAPAAPFSPLPSRLCLDHSHCPVLVPATLSALLSTRAIETRLLPSFDSCAPAQFELSVLPIYVARAPAAPLSPLPTAALP